MAEEGVSALLLLILDDTRFRPCEETRAPIFLILNI
jgi:hypothetical protein